MCSENDKMALQEAIRQAEKSMSEGGIPIGAALVDANGNIVAVGHNNRVQNNDPTAHAETECIRQAGRRRDWHTLTMATTLSPCAMCSGTAVLHKIPRIVIGENKTFLGREDWLQAENTELIVVDNDRCKQLMADFIKECPELWNEDIGIPPSSC
eukprot:m.1508011 g.1508011  ORF g.1508011 m.1508011 type:complete len:155 (+) comp25209_c0_seq139:279-743(+)